MPLTFAHLITSPHLVHYFPIQVNRYVASHFIAILFTSMGFWQWADAVTMAEMRLPLARSHSVPARELSRRSWRSHCCSRIHREQSAWARERPALHSQKAGLVVLQAKRPAMPCKTAVLVDRSACHGNHHLVCEAALEPSNERGPMPPPPARQWTLCKVSPMRESTMGQGNSCGESGGECNGSVALRGPVSPPASSDESSR